MTLPSDEKRICAMFDSFCKKVSRNYLRDLERAEERRDTHYPEEPIDYFLELSGRRDAYPSDSFVLYADGLPCAVESETLYKALLSLSERQRDVLLLGFWRGLADGEISERMEVTTRTVYNLRQRASLTTMPSAAGRRCLPTEGFAGCLTRTRKSRCRCTL